MTNPNHHPPLDTPPHDHTTTKDNPMHQPAPAPESPLLPDLDITPPKGMTPLARELWVVASRTDYEAAFDAGYYNRLARVAREFVEAEA